MLGLRVDRALHVVGVVGLLLAEVGARARHLPVAETLKPVLLVELEVPPVARVPHLPAPHLLAHLRVAREGDEPTGAAARAHEVRLQDAPPRAAVVPGGLIPAHLADALRPHDALAARPLEEVRVHEEEPDALLGEHLLDPRPHPRVAVHHGRLPGAAGPV
ncbi:MAG: hypothetical protein ACK559_26975, partial [bacterium]